MKRNMISAKDNAASSTSLRRQAPRLSHEADPTVTKAESKGFELDLVNDLLKRDIEIIETGK